MGIPEIPAQDFSKFGPIETKPLARIKRLTGPHLHRAWLNIPHVTHGDEADITELEAYRKELDAAAKEKGYRVTLLAFLMKASVSALQGLPRVQQLAVAREGRLIYKKYYNVGIAVDTPEGLVVPVFKDVDRKGIEELSKELGATSKKARDGKLGPADMQGGTFTISSLGGIGGTDFTPIVNAPEVAILGVVRSKMAPVWDGKEFQPRLMQPLYVSYDHRVIDGALAARFTRHLCHVLEDVRRLVLLRRAGTMAIEVKVPDIGDFKDVPIIEIHVQAGARVKAEDPLITLESDKATMDMPAPQAGTVAELRVKVGDRVGEGAVILLLEPEGAAAIPPKDKVKEGAAPASGEPAGYGSSAGVYETIEVKVPDIGDFKDVPVIEVHVAEGAVVKAEDPLLSLESDKATMDVPSPAAGTVVGLKVKVGDKVSEGTLILTLQTGAAKPARCRAPRRHRPPPRRRPSPPPPARATSTPRCWCWAPARAATPPPSAPPTSAARWCWSSAGRPWAASA